MPPGRNDRPVPPNARHIETLRSAQSEANKVLTQQVETLSDIDDKALRTVRIALIVSGISVSATTFPNGAAVLNWVTVVGVLSLVLSILCGIVTFGASNPSVGVGPEYLNEVRTTPYTEAEWRDLLVSGYDEWITDVERQIESNARTLLLAQSFLGCSVVLLMGGVSVALTGHAEPVVRPVA